MYNEKCRKTKRKSYNGEINTNFYNNKISKENSKFICLSGILTSSDLRRMKNVNMTKRCKSILLMRQKFLLKILIEKILTKKVLMNKILMKKISIECVYFIFKTFRVILNYS